MSFLPHVSMVSAEDSNVTETPINETANVDTDLSSEGGRSIDEEKADDSQEEDLSEENEEVSDDIQTSDESDMTVTSSVYNPTATEIFILHIIDAQDAEGNRLTGDIQVTVVSDDIEEGADGTILSGVVNFSEGTADIPIFLNDVGDHSLAVTVDGVTNVSNVMVEVLELSKMLEQAPMFSQINSSGATYVTGTDNEDNDGTSSPDHDMGEGLKKGNEWNEDIIRGSDWIDVNSPNHPIEFNINVNGQLPEESATLIIYAYDVDEEYTNSEGDEKDEVFFNGESVGFLSGANNEISTTSFVLDPDLVHQGDNLVEIEVDDDRNTAEWRLQVRWGQLLIDGGSGEDFEFTDLKLQNVNNGQDEVTFDAVVTGQSNKDYDYRLELNIIDPESNNVFLEHYYYTNPDEITETAEMKYNTDSPTGTYIVNGYLFNDTTGVLQQVRSTTFYHEQGVGIVPPEIEKVTSSNENRTYGEGELILIDVIFDAIVHVTGEPKLELETGDIDRYAKYISGTGTNTLTFEYIVETGDLTPDLEYTGTGALELNNGSILDNLDNSANVTLPIIGGGNSLSDLKDIVIDAKPVKIITAVQADFSDTERFDFTGKNNNSPTAVDDDNNPDTPPVLRLTENSEKQAGSAFIEDKIYIRDADSFSTYFTFRIDHTDTGGADGFAFVIQPISSGELNDGGGIGYAEINRGLDDGTDGNEAILKSLAVEFDTHNNDQWVVPDDLGEQNSNNHIGINVGGHIRSVAVQSIDESFINFNDGSEVHVWIDYGESSNNTIEVRIAKSNNRPDSAILSYNLDNLTQYSFDEDGSINLGGNFDLTGNFEGDIHDNGVTLGDIIGEDQAFIGFTSATGPQYEAHYITSWYFDNKYNPIDHGDNDYEQAPTIEITNVEKLKDNQFEITAVVTANDEDGNPYVVVDEKVTFKTNLGYVTPDSLATDENGEAVTILVSDETGFATITAILDSGDTAETIVEIIIPSEPTVENIEKTGIEGSTISFEFTDFSGKFEDIDGDSLTTVKLTSLPSTDIGTLKLGDVNVTEGQEIPVSDLGDLKFVPAENWNGEIEFTWNGSDGTAYADDPATVTIKLSAENDKPTVSNITKEGTEGSTITFTSTDFSNKFEDVDGDDLATVTLTNSPSTDIGTLKLGDVNVTEGQEIPFSELVNLTFVPAENWNGITTFGWNGSDGTAYADDPATVTIKLSAENDKPTVSNITKEETEGSTITFTSTDFSNKFEDVDGDDLATVSLTNSPSTDIGTLKLGDVNVTEGQEIPVSDLGDLKFVPAENWNGSTTFSWNGSDGMTYADNSATVKIELTAENDKPTISNITKEGIEGSTITFEFTDFSSKFEDIDGDSLATVTLTYLPSEDIGTLELGDVNVTEGQEIAVSDLGDLKFVPAENWNGTTTFGWNGSDGTVYAEDPATVTIKLSAENDKPTVSNITKEGTEGSTISFEFTDFSSKFEDIDGDSLATVKLTSLPSTDIGTLKLGDVNVTEGQEISELENLTFVPAKNWNGSTTFGWNGSDGKAYAEIDAQISITIFQDLDGWVGDREQGDETPIIVLPGNPLKLSAVSSLDAEKVIATYTFISDGHETIEQVELNLSNASTVDLDNEKVWTNIKYYLSDHILQDEYEVTFNAYDENDNVVQTEEESRISEDNKFHVRTTIDLEGTITDQETKEPIENAKVTLYDSAGTIQIAEVHTGVDGKYSFENIRTNTYLIEIQKSGYGIKKSSIHAIPENVEDQKIVRDFELVEFSLELFADPSAIVGDGKSTSELKALLKDKDGKVIPGVDVEFSAPRGSFENSFDLQTAISQTNGQGEAFVTYTSEKIEGVLSQSIVVQARAEYNGLIAIEEIIVTFQPGSVKGIVTQNEDLDGDGNPDPIEGVTVIITKDFDGDGNIDFSAEAKTDSEGKYSIAIPRGDVEYDVTIIKTIELDNETKEVEFHQSAEVGEVTGKGEEDFDSTKTITGVIGSKESSGESGLTPPVNNNLKVYLKDSSDQYILDAEGQPKGFPVDEDGIFNAEDINIGDYALEVRYVHDDGEEIIINERKDGSLPKVSVNNNGQLNIVEELIDPYGVITDQKTGEIIKDAKVVLYYADTKRNRNNGITPDTKVELPELVDFAPNKNHNPQYSDSFGNYAYMVYSYTDYYLTSTKSGYYTYTSPIISVETAIVRHDIEMEKKPSNNGGGTVIIPVNEMDVATNLSVEQSIYPEGSQAPVKVDFINLSEETLKKGVLQVEIPSDVKVIDADGGVMDDSTISWELKYVEPEQAISYEIMIELPKIGSEEKNFELTSDFLYAGELEHPESAKSSVKLKVVSNRYGLHEHEKYIMGYPDGTFKSEKSLTRAELAAMMARLIGKYDSANASYKDVDREYWAYEYINVVTEQGLFNGYIDHSFRPDQAITRAELAIVITRYLDLQVGAPIEMHFEDIEGIWAEAAIEALYRNSMINGYVDGTFKPNDPITRAETVVLINRMLYRGPLENISPTFPDVNPTYWAFGHIEEASVSHKSQYKEGYEEFIQEIEDQVE
ncbi:hypothetical protein EPK97_10550 [Chengkuizengella sediminis]|nr:hypothetical protein [Chengkuizengella sediminis]